MAAPRQLVRLRNEAFRWLSAPKRAVPTLNKTWSSCGTEKEEADFDLVVTNPGTSFVQVMVAKPVFANFPVFPKPCDEEEE